MIRLLAAILAPLVVVAGLLLGLPSHQAEDLQKVGAAQAPAPAALGSALDGSAATGLTPAAPKGTTRATVGSPGAASADAEASGALPLQVTLDGLSKAVVPTKGPLRVRGRVTNTSDDTWSDINVYACTSGSPITSAHELRHAAEATTDDVVCGRTSVFTTIKSLAAGDSATYRLKIPRDKLEIGDRPGVYWFGVQALGTSTAGRDALADGTIRTFLPQVGTERPPGRTSFALALPIRGRTLHTSDGKLAAAPTWHKDLAPGGRLADMLTLAESAPAGRAALLVDPAVIVAAQQLAAGDPERSLGTPVTADEEKDGDDGDKAGDDQGSGDGSGGGTKSASDEPGDAAASAWLQRFTTVAQRLPVLSLPYGDLDVAGAARHDSGALARAREESNAVFGELGVETTAVIAPTNGLLSPEARETAGGARLIASSDALPADLADDAELPGAVTIGSQHVLISDVSVARGGPAPTQGTDALALRQRLLAEGLLRAGRSSTTLVVLPWNADPGTSSRHFFDQLDRPFVRTTGALPSGADGVDVPDLTYPSSQLGFETSAATFAEAHHIAELGDTLDRLLAHDDGIGHTAARESLSATSYLTRDTSLAAAGIDGARTVSLRGATSWYEHQLARVDVAVPRFVILGSTEGPFSMTVTNGLERPIRLSVRATTSGGLDIRAPKTINVPASSSRTVNLEAQTTEPGVHTLKLVVTDADGRAIRESQYISIRSRDVGWVIWLIMGAGAALLFGAIAMRWRKRLRKDTA